MRELRILNLGAGVQSTTLYLMFMQGILRPKLDYAIFADTQDEPAAVYKHLAWLKSLNKLRPTAAPILTPTKGRLSDHLKQGRNSTGGRFVSIPAFVKGGTGVVRRQCSKEYKIEVIERCLRREVLGLQPRQRIPKDVTIHQYYGISLDEGGRAVRIKANAPKGRVCHFPLIEAFMTRPLCENWLRERGHVPHEVPRSACVFCPYHNDLEWLRIKAVENDWRLAVEVDSAIRQNRKLDQQQYVHRSCTPLVNIAFSQGVDPRAAQLSMNFNGDCQGVCGV